MNDTLNGLISGRLQDLAHVKGTDINVFEIAWSLSMQNRFMGHAPVPWSVLSHTGLVLQLYTQEARGDTDIHKTIHLMLHDAAEAYIGDIIRPLRRQPQFAFFNELEDRVLRTIFARFGYDYDVDVDKEFIDRYDTQACHVEMALFWPEQRNNPQFCCPAKYPMESYPASLAVARVEDYVAHLRELTVKAGKAPHISALFELPATMEHLISNGPRAEEAPEMSETTKAALESRLTPVAPPILTEPLH